MICSQCCCQAGSGAKLENATRGIFLIAHREQQWKQALPLHCSGIFLPQGPATQKLCSQRGSVLLILFLPAPSLGGGWERGAVLAACTVCLQPAQGQSLLISCSRVSQFPHPTGGGCRSQPVTAAPSSLQRRWLLPAAVPVLLLLLLLSGFSFPCQPLPELLSRSQPGDVHSCWSLGSVGGGKGKLEQEEEDEVRLQRCCSAAHAEDLM